jgi:hypothetical protein
MSAMTIAGLGECRPSAAQQVTTPRIAVELAIQLLCQATQKHANAAIPKTSVGQRNEKATSAVQYNRSKMENCQLALAPGRRWRITRHRKTPRNRAELAKVQKVASIACSLSV